MIKLGQNIYSNFNQSDIPKEVAHRVRAVVMGNCGTGKTSLFNKLCDKNYPTGFTTNGESQTADIDFEDVAYTEPNKFRMYDSPGTDSVSDALHLALILRTSLTCLSINLVIVSVKFETPILPIFSQLKKFLQIVKGYGKLVVCMMSHLDLLDNKPDKEKTLCQLAEVVKKQLNNEFKLILYSNKTTNPKVLSDILFRMGKSNKQQEIKISDETFFKYFNISFPLNKIINDTVDKYIDKVKDETQLFFDFFKTFQPQAATSPNATSLNSNNS